MKRIIIISLTVFCIFAFVIPGLAGGRNGYYRYPAIYKDVIVFTSEGDLWSVNIKGGLRGENDNVLIDSRIAIISVAPSGESGEDEGENAEDSDGNDKDLFHDMLLRWDLNHGGSQNHSALRQGMSILN